MSEPAESRRLDQVPSALACLDVLMARLRGRRVALFLDYDGTLTPIVPLPEQADLSPRARRVVERLAARMPVGVVSGRDRADVAARVGVERAIYAGNHGFDIALPGETAADGGRFAAFTPLLARAAERLHLLLDPVPGALIEHKRFSVAAHYRNVPPDQAHRVAAAVAEVAGAIPELAVKHGKMVFELQPAVDWNKGKAVLWLLQRLGLGGAGAAPLYLGDDVTDEDAFRALQGSGTGIIVADPSDKGRQTFADYRVDDVGQALDFLERLADAMA